MRSEQFMGLTPNAIQFLRTFATHKVQVTTIKKYENGKITNDLKEIFEWIEKTIVATFDGAFGGSYELSRYTLKDGSFATEYVQAEPWSSGPMYFIALREFPQLNWTDKEIEEEV